VAKRKPFCRQPLLASRSKSARPSYPLRTPFSYPDRRLDFSECANSEEVIVQLSFDLDGPHLTPRGRGLPSPLRYAPHRNIVELGRFTREPLQP
jgi:hypothetical protein